jgi:excisionase family DNA binding protein
MRGEKTMIQTPTRFEDLKIITLTRACKQLQMARSDILALVESGHLPAYRIGRLWRFEQEHITLLVEQKH